jgi:hypothetical protein
MPSGSETPRRVREGGKARLPVVAMLIVGMVLFCGAVWAARPGQPASPPEALGMMAVKGRVWLKSGTAEGVEEVAAPPSTVVYAGDTVKTEAGGAAVVRMKSGLTMALGERGEVELGTRGEVKLRKGMLQVANAGREAARVGVLGRQVELRAREGVAAEGRIAVEDAGPHSGTVGARGQRAEVMAERGEMEILGSRAQRMRLPAGQVAWLGAEPALGGAAKGASPAPQAAVRKAGTVTGEIPAETIQRQGAGEAQPLGLREAVNWQDVVETKATGRVRIGLLDGSVLNVGARSVMRIVEHNPQTEQTEVELTLGRVRSQVVKLTKPGASFKMKTQTAVIGVVGTIFVVEATGNSTRVMCIEGRVAVSNINPAIQGQVQLGPGQTTVVESGLAPTAATATNASELQTAVDRTEVQPGLHAAAPETTPAQAGTAGRQAGTGVAREETSAPGAGSTTAGTSGAAGAASGAGTTLTVGTTAAAAAGGVSAVAGVTALSRANDAANALNQTDQTLSSATAAANAATTAINQSNQNALSPSTPCGCGP